MDVRGSAFVVSLRVSNAEKDLLLVTYERPPVARRVFFSALLLFFAILIIVIPKIYISNEIYLLSRDVSELYSENGLLIEERHRLQRTLEDIKMRNLLQSLGD